MSLFFTRQEVSLYNVLCAYSHTLSYTFTGKKVTPSSVSDSADVPVALRSSRGELVKFTLCIYTHTLSYTFTGGKKVTPSSVSDSADVPVLH